MSTFSQRMIGAATLEVSIYKEVRADAQGTGQAMRVVVLSSIAQGIYAFTLGGILGFARGTVTALIVWFVWVFVVYLVGTKLLPEPQTRSDVGELLRTAGFSASPGLLRVLGVLPILGSLIRVAVDIWMFLTMIMAVRQALSYESIERTVGVCLIGWVPHIVIGVMLRRLVG